MKGKGHSIMQTELTRRGFLSCAMAFAAGRAFAAPHGVFSSGVPRLTFAAVSDIHIKSPKSHLKYDTAVFEHALEWYRAQGVDAVLVAGDLADSGLVEELEMVGAAWRKIFPEDKGQDGRHVEKVFVTGNHDHDAWHYGDFAHSVHPDPADFEAHKLVNDYPRHWKAAFGEDYAPIYMKTVGGFRFVASHWDDGDFKQFGPRLKAFLEAHREELSGPRPFFYVQHPHPRGTVFDGNRWSWLARSGVADNGTVTAALADFPNAVVFSGHSHWSITDERSIWQGAFTSVNLGCLRRTGFCRTKNGTMGYENWRTPGKRKKMAAAVQIDEAKTMPHYQPSFRCHHGSLVRVYDDRIVIERREFTNDRPVGDDWVIPLPAATSRPFAYDKREKESVAPEFPSDARLTIERTNAKNRAGNMVPAVKLSFPAANAVKGTRPFDYLVEIKGGNGESLTRAVLAQGVELGADSKAANGASRCVLACESLPKGTILFSVRPGACFGALGRPLTATYELM